MNDDRLLFSTVKVHRGWYFAEYAPPIRDTPFATLGVITLEPRDAATVALAMEEELERWLARYPVPIMVSAFTDSGNLVRIEPARPSDHLIGWPGTKGSATIGHWRILPYSDLPKFDLSPSALRRVYHDVPVRTSADLLTAGKAHQRTARIGTALVFVVFVVVPLTWLLVEFNAPPWLSWLILLYGFSQLYIKALKFLGQWPQSAADGKKASDETAMRHHHYHCQRNPEGFRRLAAENFDREEKEKTRQEAERLKQQEPVDAE